MYQSIRLKLNLSENEINESGISDLCSCLSNCTSLSNLSLELVYLDIGHKCLTILSSLFQKLKNLSYLSINLNRNNIGVQEVTVLSSVIGKCSNLKALEFILHIFGEGVGPPLQGVGFKKAKGIPCTNKVINKYYELSDTPKNNKIGQEGISELISCMNKCSNLRILTLRLDFENFGVEVFPIITSRLGQLKNLTNLTIKEFLLFPLGCKTQSCQTCDFFKIQKLVQVNIIQVDATNIMQKYYLICKRQERLLETLCEQEQNDNEFTSAKLNVLHFNKTLSQLQQSKLKNALLCDKKTKLKKFWQIQSSKRNQMNQQLLGGSENYSKLKNPLDHQQQLRDDEQDSFNYQQTIQKKQHDKQEVLSKVNKKIESIKIEKDQDETQQGIENDLNLLIQILYDKHQEIVISDQSIEIKKEISKGEQKIEQLQNSTNIQQIYMASKSSDYVSECASNQYSIPQFEQKGVQRFQSTKENLISLEQNKKNKLNKAQQNLKLNCEQFLREIFQLGDHLNSGGEADIFIHKNDESIAYRVIKVKNDEDLDEQLLELQSIKVLNEQNILDLNVSHMLEDRINNNMYLIHVMQKCEMSLQDEIISNKSFSLNEILSLISTGFHLLIALRQKYIYHSDIKPGNILKIGDDNYKLSDFGASQKVNFNDPFTEWKMATMAFIPKKQTLDLPFYHDIYSFGKTIEMVLQQLENHQEIKLSLQQFMNEDLCRDDENSIQTNCFELPKKFINIIIKFISNQEIDSFLLKYLKQIEQYLITNKEDKVFEYESQYQYAQIALLILSLQQLKAIFYVKENSTCNLLNNNLSLENQNILLNLLKQVNKGEEYDKLKIKIIELLLQQSDDISPILLDFYSKLKKQDQNQEPKMIYKLMIKLIRYLKKQNCYDQSLFNLIKFIQEDKINQNSVYQQKLLKEMVTKIQEISQLPFQEYHLYNKLNYNRKYFDTDDQNQYQFFSENANGKKEQQIIQSINLISKVIFQYLENDTISEKKNSNVGQLNFITYFDCKKISLKFIGSEELFNKTFKSFSSQLYFGNIILHNLSTKHRKEEVLKEITTLNVEMQNRQFSQYSLENEKTLNLSLKKIYNLTQINMPCFTFFISKLTNITTLKLQLKQYLNETININNEVNSVLLNIDLFINALPLQNITHLTLDNGKCFLEFINYIYFIFYFNFFFKQYFSQNFIGNEITQCVVSIVENCQCLTDLNLELRQYLFFTILKNLLLNIKHVLILNYFLLSNQHLYEQLLIIISANFINDDGVYTIATSLILCQNIVKLSLNLSLNNISIDGAVSLTTALENNFSIKQLNINLSGNQIGNEVAQCVVNIIQTSESLTNLSVGLDINSINDEGVQIIANALNNCKNITEFQIGLKQNYINLKGASILLKALENSQQFKIASFDLSENYIEEEELKKLIKAFIINREEFKSQQNEISNQISDITSKDLDQLIQIDQSREYNLLMEQHSLITNNPQVNLDENLTTNQINLNSSSDQISDTNLFNITKELKNITLSDFYINKSSINNQIAQIIAQGLKHMNVITELNLNLSYNDIGIQGAKHISNALKKCRNIIQLDIDLDQNNIQDEGAQSIVDTFVNCQSMITFNLKLNQNNMVKDDSDFIADILSQCKNVNQLDINLEENKINAEGVSTLAKALERCDKITNLYLNLKRNQIDDQGFNNAMGIMFKNKNISIFNINFNCCNIGANNSLVVSNNFEQCQNIIELTLKLKLNLIGIEAAKNIANVLKKCQNLTKLNINLARNYQIKPSANNISCSGAKSIAVALGHCRNLKILNLDISQYFKNIVYQINSQFIIFKINFQSNNKITSEGKQFIADSLEKCQNINKLNLSLGNNSQVDIINNNEPNIIADTLQNIENITELSLDFQFNDIDINGNKILVTALENNQNIRSLELNLDRGKVHFK
ncbi:hypothetical protein ABPG74_004839 [Tetrahymena malaccensis]